jgi:hypothetical protein
MSCSLGIQGREVLLCDLLPQPDISADTTELDLLLLLNTGMSSLVPAIRRDPKCSLGAAPTDCGKICSRYPARRIPSTPAKYAR